tara:strand:- start:2409 stop:3332 length:924 start_codon:yes stop_codon:yes gene_type:complete
MNFVGSNNNKDMRDAFFDEIYLESIKNPNLIVITNDMDIFSLRKLKKERPNQFINVGVAEQNMINIASGLASAGMKVIIYGIAPFVVFRCFEQIKMNICSMNLPVSIVGIGSGVSFAFDGPTHHAIQDISVMNALPEMSILNPSDSNSAKYCSDLILNTKKPFYVRLDKGVHPMIHNFEKFESFEIIKPIQKTTILSTGTIVSNVIEATKNIMNVGLIDIVKLKPFPSEIINLLENTDNVIVIEEHSKSGGLASIFNDAAAENNFTTKLNFIGFENKQLLEYGSREWFHKEAKIDIKSLTEKILRIL